MLFLTTYLIAILATIIVFAKLGMDVTPFVENLTVVLMVFGLLMGLELDLAHMFGVSEDIIIERIKKLLGGGR